MSAGSCCSKKGPEEDSEKNEVKGRLKATKL
jgi:hypothetical protein